jgi:hypothetical protein
MDLSHAYLEITSMRSTMWTAHHWRAAAAAPACHSGEKYDGMSSLSDSLWRGSTVRLHACTSSAMSSGLRCPCDKIQTLGSLHANCTQRGALRSMNTLVEYSVEHCIVGTARADRSASLRSADTPSCNCQATGIDVRYGGQRFIDVQPYPRLHLF